MSAPPDVSVIMSVYNGAERLTETVESILTQEGASIEFVIINDGSTDGTDVILDECAKRDARVHVLNQQHEGLTRALIKGCALARGEYIARQDAGGDVSLPGRLAHQLTFLRTHPEAAMTACGTRMIGPGNEVLYEVCQHGHELHDHLRSTSAACFLGPSHHGAVMFRKSAYALSGGYRGAFKVAQDLDLWSRMSEIGACLATPEILYETRLTKGSISQLSRRQQMRATLAIFECAKARRTGGDESCILENFRKARVRKPGVITARVQDAQFYYFIGSLLRKHATQQANVYFLRALYRWPFDPRSWFGLLRSVPLSRKFISFEARPDQTPRRSLR